MKAIVLAVAIAMALTACAPARHGLPPTIFDRISGGE